MTMTTLKPLTTTAAATSIHPTAIIADGAEIGAGCTIGPFCTISAGTKLGAGNVLHSHVVIEGNCTIGDNNSFFQFCVIGSQPQVERWQAGGESRIEIGNHNTFREYVTIQPGMAEYGGITKIGDHNWLMIGSHVGHDCVLGNHNRLTNNVPLGGHVTLHNHVIVSGLCGVTQFVTIGSHAFIGAGSIVASDIPPFCTAQGNHATLVGINSTGLKRHGYNEAQISSIKTAFRSVFFADGVFAEKLAATEASMRADTDAMQLINFVKNSARGIAPFVKRAEK